MTIQTPQSIKVQPVKVEGATVGEFVTEARIEALNAALAAHGVDSSRIITVFEIPGQPVANGHPARYHVLYRKP